MRKEKTIILAAVSFIALCGAILFPLLAIAGSLEPSAAPAPTMRTLDEIYNTGSWSKKIPCEVGNCPRFEVLTEFNNEAVLDRETGLVWERSPSTLDSTWADAVSRCTPLMVGGRKGWRLPTVEQLASLVDYRYWDPSLPPGHPFLTALPYLYWSASTPPANSTSAWGVSFSMGNLYITAKNIPYWSWCVRGGQGRDTY